MENLTDKTEELIKDFAEHAIEISGTYSEAIEYIRQEASLTEHGQAIKNAIQDEIIKRALNSKIREVKKDEAGQG